MKVFSIFCMILFGMSDAEAVEKRCVLIIAELGSDGSLNEIMTINDQSTVSAIQKEMDQSTADNKSAADKPFRAVLEPGPLLLVKNEELRIVRIAIMRLDLALEFPEFSIDDGKIKLLPSKAGSNRYFAFKETTILRKIFDLWWKIKGNK